MLGATFPNTFSLEYESTRESGPSVWNYNFNEYLLEMIREILGYVTINRNDPATAADSVPPTISNLLLS